MIKVHQLSPAHIEISMPGQPPAVIPNENGPAMLQALAQQAPGQVRVELRGRYRLDLATEKAALEIAGLNGLAAAKQTSTGYIEF
jgi:hypothetical protein